MTLSTACKRLQAFYLCVQPGRTSKFGILMLCRRFRLLDQTRPHSEHNLPLTMTSYLRSWLTTSIPAAAVEPPAILTVSPPPSDDEDDTETEKDDDSPPAFPSLNSAQRMNAGIPSILTDSQLMPPPPLPRLASRNPGVAVPSAPSSSLAVPTTTTKRPPKPKKRDKVALAPGHSPLDWANLKSSGTDLRVRTCHVSFNIRSTSGF